MKETEFGKIESVFSDLYDGKRYSAALSFLEDSMKNLSAEEIGGHFFKLTVYKALVLNRLEMYEEHFRALRELVDRGFACPRYMMEASPFSEEQRYISLEKDNDLLMSNLRATAHLEYEVHLPEGFDETKKYPVFFALHGDGVDQNVKTFKTQWKPEPFTESGIILVYVQSSQVACHLGYGWLEDPVMARKDLKTCYNLVSQRYGIDGEAIMVGGFSGGAIASVDMVMTDVLPIKGFIAICPEVKPESVTDQNVEWAVQRGVRGVFMEGEKELPVPDEDAMTDLFRMCGLPFRYYVNEGIGHSVPEDLSVKAREALGFILER